MLPVLLSLLANAGIPPPPPHPIEYCPADVTVYSQGVMDGSGDQLRPSAAYGFELFAEGERTVTGATLAFDTDAGWFTVNVPPLALHERVLRYRKPDDLYTDPGFVSGVQFVRFERTLTVNRVWVTSARARGAGAFDWNRKDVVACEPDPERDAHSSGLGPIPVNGDPIGEAPPPGSVILTPVRSRPLRSSACHKPFDDIHVLTGLDPDATNGNYSNAKLTLVRFAVDAAGSVAGSWVASSSGYPELDEAARAAPYRAAFEAGRAYCKPVPGIFSVVLAHHGSF